MTQLESLIDGWRRPGVKWLVAFTAALLIIVYLAGVIAARAEVKAVQLTVPLDIVALVQVIFTGLAACGGVFATIYLPIVNARQKRAELTLAETNLKLLQAQVEISKVKDNMVLIERNTNSLTKEIAALSKKEGEHIGEKKEQAKQAEAAAVLEEGKRQGVASVTGNPDPKQ